jgi:hypothetical protein
MKKSRLSPNLLINKVKLFISKFIGRVRPHLVKAFSLISKPDKINIGSGRRAWMGWICLDELTYPSVTKLRFTPSVNFPVRSNSISLAYNSHNLEHLTDEVVDRILVEVKRCLKSSGLFVVKIPDFDFFIDQYRLGNSSAMSNKGCESIIWSWKNYGVEDTFENRTAMMFSGYWNNSYGDHFSGRIYPANPSAYHGPPVVEKSRMVSILTELDIRSISKTLNQIVLEDKEFKAFNHCNAWSKRDLENLLISHGFEILKMDKKEVINRFKPQIPDLESMFDWSMIVVASKP